MNKQNITEFTLQLFIKTPMIWVILHVKAFMSKFKKIAHFQMIVNIKT